MDIPLIGIVVRFYFAKETTSLPRIDSKILKFILKLLLELYTPLVNVLYGNERTIIRNDMFSF